MYSAHCTIFAYFRTEIDKTMAGIYIHIPYCITRCSYCDFYTVVDTHTKSDFTGALCKEIKNRAEYLENEPIKTIYLGGGTPSVLSVEDLKHIFDTLYKTFNIVENAEITMEANPDDLTEVYVKQMEVLPVNRLSMGVQSFDDDDLKFMNRRHNAAMAIDVVQRVLKAGYKNVTIDLIYGLPKQSPSKWKKNLDIALKLGVQHLSCYHLMYEEGTPLYQQLHKKKVTPITEKVSNKLFEMLIEETDNAGFEHYEISNFALPGYYSKHNTSYWTGEKYLGVGPSAHSFNGKSRQWNKKGVHAYLKALEHDFPVFEMEELTEIQRFNEYVITRMRTQWGCVLEDMRNRFSENHTHEFEKNIKKWVSRYHVLHTNVAYIISKSGIMISDAILADIILDDD